MAANLKSEVDLLAAAQRYLKAGLSPIPLKADGSKAPDLERGDPVLLRTRRATDEELSRWFPRGRCVGLGISGGPISGGLAVIDFDDPATFEPWRKIVEREAPGLLLRLVRTNTPRRSPTGDPGVHICARVKGDPIRGRALARWKSNGKARIEVRGDGNYVVVPPSNGTCHETGRPWVYAEGSPTLEDIPTITREEWGILEGAAQSFDERPVAVCAPKTANSIRDGALRPGDDFAARGNVAALLREAGAVLVYTQEGVGYWRRPGPDKTRGISATLGFHKTDKGEPCLHVFTSSWPPFEAGRSYDPFSIYASLKHGGNYVAAAKGLAAEGYGKKQAVSLETPGAAGRERPPADADPLPGLTSILFEDLLALSTVPREVLLGPWLRAKDLAMIYAFRGVGKTWVSLGIALAVSSGKPFLKWNASKSRRVLLVDGEMPYETLRERSAALCRGCGFNPQGRFKIICADLQDGVTPNIATPEGQEAIEKHLDGIDLVIFDNLSCLCGGIVENESDSWEPVQRWLLSLRRRGITVVFMHHAGKGGDQRGASKKEDVLDVSILLKTPRDYDPQEGARFEVHFKKTRGLAGPDVASFQATAQEQPDKGMKWATQDLADQVTEEIIGLYEDGRAVREIAKIIGLNASNVSRRLTAARQAGRLGPEGGPK